MAKRLCALCDHLAAVGHAAPGLTCTESARGGGPKYRGAVIGLGWMGLLYDLAERVAEEGTYNPNAEALDRPGSRPTPALDVHREIHHHAHPGNSGIPTSYSEALHHHPGVELVACADPTDVRQSAFLQRYPGTRAFDSAEAMLAAEKPDIVAIATNTKGRAELTALAVKYGAKAVLTDKPMAHSLAEVDLMVQTCADAGVPLNCGAISTTDPSFAKAKELLQDGAIGKLLSMECAGPGSQHQGWTYFLDSAPAWCVGYGHTRPPAPLSEKGGELSTEFDGQGMLVAEDGVAVFFRQGFELSMGLRLNGTTGFMQFEYPNGWSLVQTIELPASGTTPARPTKLAVPWPEPQFLPPYGATYGLADVIDCLEGRLAEPKNSGRRVGVAIETEVALKLSSASGGQQVKFPVIDRSLRLQYDWFR